MSETNAQGVTRRRLLLVEDDSGLSSAIADTLDEAGYEVLRAENGEAALDQLRGGANPDVIVLDLMMPKMDGWQFRLAQMQDSRFVQTPVIVITANRSAQARAVDADAHLTKPFPLQSLVGAVERAIELRDRRRAATNRAHDDRFASVWTLAAGIAHEINNPLTGLLGHVDLAERLVREDPISVDRVLSCLGNIKQAGLQIGQVVKDASTLTDDDDSLVPIDPVQPLESALRMLSTEITGRAKVESRHEPVPRVRASPAGLLQVFMNLLLNAAQSIPDDTSGVIRTRTFTSDDGGVVIQISDSGCGIAPEHTVAIFDPFFTTKPPGHGTGLGLSISQNTISRFGGRITVESALDVGSTFTITLPPAAPASIDEPTTHGKVNRLQILLVEEDGIVANTIRLLSSQHDVIVEREISRARERVLSGERFDVVLCDLDLPDGSAAELYVAMSHFRPELVDRFVLITAATRRKADIEFVNRLGARALTKPFEHGSLERAIREAASATITKKIVGESE